MHDDFVDWCRIVDPRPVADTLEKRWEVVKELAKRRKVDFWLDCVRLYIGFEIDKSSLRDKLVASFKEADPTFSIKDNTILLQIMAGSILMQLLESQTKHGSICAAALICSDLHGSGTQGPIPELLLKAQEYISDRSRHVRSPRRTRRASLEKLSKSENPFAKVSTPSVQNISQNQWPLINTSFNEITSTLGDVLVGVKKLHAALNSSVGEVEGALETLRSSELGEQRLKYLKRRQIFFGGSLANTVVIMEFQYVNLEPRLQSLSQQKSWLT